jgi:uncharacterized protein
MVGISSPFIPRYTRSVLLESWEIGENSKLITGRRPSANYQLGGVRHMPKSATISLLRPKNLDLIFDATAPSDSPNDHFFGWLKGLSVQWIVSLLLSALVIPFAAPVAAAVVNRDSLPPASAKAKQDNRIGQSAYDADEWVEALAALSSACDAYVPDACSTLGSLYLNGLGVEKDEARAVALFEQSCHEGSNSGCGRAGAVMLYGFASRAVNPEVGIPMSEKSCAGGFGIACNNLGKVYFQGKLVPTNQPLALRYFERACILQERGGCSNAGDLYLDGKGVVADSRKAFSFYSKACNLREGSACVQMGSMLYSGNGVRADKGFAANAFVAGCNLNNAQGCILAAQRFDKGDGVAQDQSRATSLFAKACKGRDAEGCYWIGWRSQNGIGAVADTSAAQNYFAKACTLGRKEACVVQNQLTHSTRLAPQPLANNTNHVVEDAHSIDPKLCRLAREIIAIDIKLNGQYKIMVRTGQLSSPTYAEWRKSVEPADRQLMKQNCAEDFNLPQ